MGNKGLLSHLHTRKNLSFDQKWGKEPSRKVLNRILKLVLRNRVALFKEWELKVG